jgi:glycerol-3-phosphate dehydrogenase (NAD+)
MWLLGVHI